jgi:hypothetical protein
MDGCEAIVELWLVYEPQFAGPIDTEVVHVEVVVVVGQRHGILELSAGLCRYQEPATTSRNGRSGSPGHPFGVDLRAAAVRILGQ